MKKRLLTCLLCFFNQSVLSADFSCVEPNGASKMVTFFNQIYKHHMESGLLPPNEKLVRTDNSQMWEYTNKANTKAVLEVKSADTPKFFVFSLYNPKGSTIFVYKCIEILQAK